MAKRGKFVYRGGDRTVEEVVRKSKQSGGAYDSYLQSDVQMLKVKEGETTLRILPPSWDEKGDEKWGRGWDIGIWIHYEVGPDKATYLCLDKMRGETCPVCEARRQGTDDERDALKPQWRALVWVINRDDEKAGPQIWSMPTSVFREINLRSVDKKHNTPIHIDDPEEGYDITLSRDGTGLKTKYSGFEIDRDPTPLHEDEKIQDKWLEYISENPLPDILQFYDAAHIESVLFGKGGRGDDDGDAGGGDDKRARPSRGRSTDDRERDYVGDEDDEPEASAGSRRASRSRRDDDDGDREPDRRTRTRGKADDDDEPSLDEDDETEADAPRGGRGERGRATERRRSTRTEEPADEEPDPEDEPEDDVDTAKRKLDEMKRRRQRR